MTGVQTCALPICFPVTIASRKDLNAIAELPIKTAYGFQRLGHFVELSYDVGASELKSEMGKKVNYIYITLKEGFSSKTYKEEATKILKESVELPTGFLHRLGRRERVLRECDGALAVYLASHIAHHLYAHLLRTGLF